jgi:serine/threonine-protein kinase RsbW
MASEPSPWALTIPSDLRMLALARAFVEAVCQVAGLDEATTNAVVMATDEATNNVMRHAHQGRPDASLQIQCFFRPDSVEVRVLDEGPPFDLDAVPRLDPAELRVGGRGVFLMRTLMDELSCEPRGPRGNTLRMVKHYRRPSGPPRPAPRPDGAVAGKPGPPS